MMPRSPTPGSSAQSASTFPDECYYACRMDPDCPMGGHCVTITGPSSLEGTPTTGVKGCFK